MPGIAGAGIVAFHDASTGELRFAPQDEILVFKASAGEATVVECKRSRYPMRPELYRLSVRETPGEIEEQIRGGLPAREVE